MRRIHSFQRFADLVQNFKIQYPAVWTNCFLLPAEIGGLIKAGRIRYIQNGRNQLFFVAEEFCERLYAYSASPEPLKKAVLETLSLETRTVALNVVTRAADDGAENPALAKWTQSGFRPRGVYRRMAVAAEKAAGSEPMTITSPSGVLVRTQGAERIPEILALWRKCLDPLSVSRPDADGLRALMAQNRVRFIVSNDNALCAVMVSDLAGKKATVDHVAVHPAYRRQGLARTLLKASIYLDLQSGVDAFRLWVDEKNEPAIRLYEEFGFAPDGTQSRLFVRERPDDAANGNGVY